MADVILKMYQVFPNDFYNLISCHTIDHILKYDKKLNDTEEQN